MLSNNRIASICKQVIKESLSDSEINSKFMQKGTFENKIWLLIYKCQSRGYGYVPLLLRELTKRYPNVHFSSNAPNMGHNMIKVIDENGRELSRLDLESDYNPTYLVWEFLQVCEQENV